MSLTFSVPSFEDISSNAAVKRTDSVNVNGQTVSVWHSSAGSDVRGVVSVDENTYGFFPMTQEIVVYEDERKSDSVSAVDQLLGENPDLTSINVYEAQEAACLLRVFYAAGQWFVSTNQKLDASKSSWTAKKSFREQFQDSLNWLYHHSRQDSSETCPDGDYTAHVEFWRNAPDLSTPTEIEEWFLNTLDTEKSYAFLVQPTVENKNFFVTPPSENPLVKNVGVFVNNGTTLLYNEQVLGVPKPTLVQHPTEPTDDDFDLLTWLFDKTHKGGISRQGLMVFTGNAHFKLINHEYHYKSGLRENNTVLFQYVVYNMNLSLVPDKDYESYCQRFEDFKSLYSGTWNEDFEAINDALTDVTLAIARAYFRRNRPKPRDDSEEIPRDMRRLHQPEYKLLMDIHEAWKSTEDPETHRKRYRVFRFPNPNFQQRGKPRHNPFVHDPETNMEYNMDAVWRSLYHQDPYSVYKMVMRRLRFGENWTVYQPDSPQNRRNRQRTTKPRPRQSFGRRRLVTRSTGNTE
jgi:hypothetical protein